MKITKSLAIILAIVAIAGVGTYALYSDTATISNNTFSADSMNLKIDQNPDGDENYVWSEGFENTVNPYAHVKPGSIGHQVIDISNFGDVDGSATIKLHVVADTPLYHNMNFVVTFDANHDGDFETPVASGPLTAWNNNVYPMGKILGNLADGTSNGKIASVRIDWSVPSSAGNEIMGSNVVIDTVFGLNQIAED